MPDTLTARDRYHLKKYGSVDSPVLNNNSVGDLSH